MSGAAVSTAAMEKDQIAYGRSLGLRVTFAMYCSIISFTVFQTVSKELFNPYRLPLEHIGLLFSQVRVTLAPMATTSKYCTNLL